MTPSHEGSRPAERDSVPGGDRGSSTTSSAVRGLADAPRTGAPPVPRLDLSTPEDVHDLVVAFYREIMLDELLEPIFSDVAEVDWVEHIPRLIDYWCWILLGAPSYAGTVTKTHRHLHSLQPLEPDHCDRWFSLWVHCVDERSEGRNAERAKNYAASMMEGLAKHVFGFTWTRGGTQSSTADSKPLPELQVG